MWWIECESVSWSILGRSDRIRRVVAVFVEEGRVLGRCSVSVGYCVSLLATGMKCSNGIVRVCGGVDKGVAIE